MTETDKNGLPFLFADREAWLVEAASMIFEDIISEHTNQPEPPTRVSCGFPRGSRGGAKHIGVTYPRSASADSVNEIFITPQRSDSLEVLEILTHEMIHATLDNRGGHRGEFALIARAVGLEGPLTATHAGPALLERLNEITAVLGGYPHAKLESARKKDSTRQRKCQCMACGLILRMSVSAIEKVRKEVGDDDGNCPAGCGYFSLKMDV